jgi:hypothetical protein
MLVSRQRESALAEWIRNRKPVLTSDLSSARLTEAVDYLSTARPTYVSGYVSAVAELARQARLVAARGSRPLVPFVKVFGELIHQFQRQEIEESLGARVIETYGCSETGTAGYECPAGSLHIFAEHVEVEILRNGEPVEPGEAGDIVLTCTTNRVMPLIRYRVGDRGRLSPDPCRCGRPHPVLARVEGRIGDVLLTVTGGRVHGTALGDLVKRISAESPTAIGRVLFEQHDVRTWIVPVQPGPGFGDGIAALLVDGVRKAVAAALKAIYRAPTAEAARAALEAFAASDWGRKYPPIAPAWRRHWEQVIPLFAHPPEIRRMLYTTNAIESLHMQLRKALKIRGHFPTDEAATKLIYLVLRNISRRWHKAPQEWKAAMNQFAILYPDRFTVTG